ncbi:calcium-binding protein [Microvirga sp. 2YAF29]|uniref:calcium-binding protein n=1 Tax=Microvirga sp. 2YAF29 TaxID=3233031 RepID=UPI003F96A4D0
MTLMIKLGDAYAFVREYFSEGSVGRIENIEFSDGTVWHRDDVLAVIESEPPPLAKGKLIIGTDADEILVGTDYDDTIDGGLGSDLLKGGAGNDTYVWGRTSGTDIIIDESGYDIVHIDATTAEITLSASTDDGSLVIALNGKFLTIRDYFNTATSGHIEDLTFADGSRWGLAEVQSALAGNPPPPPPPGGKVLVGTDADEILTGTDFGDTISGGAGTDLLEGGYGDDVYIWKPGHGIDVVRDYGGNDTVLIDATPDQLKFYGSLDYKGYPLIIKLGTEQLAIEGYFSEESFKNGHIERLVFSDGTVWTKADVLKALIPVELPPHPSRNGKVIVGTQASEVLTGTDFNDTIDGGGGDDELLGGKGNDVYVWGPLSGNDLILDSGGNDTIKIKAASSNAELFAHFDGTLIISIMGQTLTIRNYLATGENIVGTLRASSSLMGQSGIGTRFSKYCTPKHLRLLQTFTLWERMPTTPLKVVLGTTHSAAARATISCEASKVTMS